MPPHFHSCSCNSSDFWSVWSLSVAFVILFEIAVLADALGVCHLICVIAFGCQALASLSVVTVITHTLGIMFTGRVLTSSDAPPNPLIRGKV